MKLQITMNLMQNEKGLQKKLTAQLLHIVNDSIGFRTFPEKIKIAKATPSLNQERKKASS